MALKTTPEHASNSLRYCMGCDDFVALDLFAKGPNRTISCKKRFYSLLRWQEISSACPYQEAYFDVEDAIEYVQNV